MSYQPLFLFAEDDDEDWMLIERTFKNWPQHYLIERAKDGEAVLERLRDPSRPQPDVVLLDIKMPRKSGLEALKEIRKDTSLKHIPVVMMTNSSSESDVLNSYVEGCNSFLVKMMTSDQMQAFQHYWTQVSRLPKKSRSGKPGLLDQ